MELGTQQVYEVMAGLDHALAEGLALRLERDVQQVTDSLAELRGLGLIEESQVVDGAWRAVAPTLAIGRQISERESEIAHQLAKVSEHRELLGTLNEIYRRAQTDPHAIVRLADRDGVLAHMGALVETVTTEVAAFVTRAPGTTGMAQAHELDSYLLDKGVALRTLCLDSFRRDRRMSKSLRASAAMGSQVRTLPALPTRMIIFDREQAVIATDPSDPSEGALLIAHSAAVALFVDLFERYWAEAQPFLDRPDPALSPDASATRAAELSPMELYILRMLSTGVKDDAIARSTGQSVRTVRRVISALSEKVGARGRFDLALHAAARGWVSLGDTAAASGHDVGSVPGAPA